MPATKISVCLSKAILLKDAFSEEPVGNGVRIRTAQGKSPIAKPGGYWLFLNMGTEPFEAEIASPVYRPEKILLRPDGGEKAEEIFLYPSPAYPVRDGSTLVLGAAAPETKLWFYLAEKTQERKLLEDYQKGKESISIFMRHLSGGGKRNWYIWDKEKKRGEFFQVRTEADETENYELSASLKENYRRKDTLIYPAWECMTDSRGEFFLILDGLKEQKYRLCCSFMQKNKQISKEVEIVGGKQTRCCL